MKPQWKLVTLAVVVTVVVLSLTSVALAATSGDTAPILASLTPARPSVSAHVEQHLVVLREEEKLARDVYAVLYAKWEVPVFRNIGVAEGHHMGSVKMILDRYGIDDPVGSNPPGVFTNPKLQKAYAELVAKGTKSLTDAYETGVAIEKGDVALLKDLIGDSNRRDVTRMATNLLQGSQNHLAAFTRLLSK